jgi:hypothetical protein
MELVDLSSERKFVKTKLDTQASSFLTDKTAYNVGFLTDKSNKI